MDVESLISSHIRGLEAYEPPDWDALAVRAGVKLDQLIRLDANENPYGPLPGVVDALAQFHSYGFYPDYGALQAEVAKYAGVEPEKIVLGNGGDEIIDLAIRVTVEPGEGVVICPPAFGMYAVCTRANRGVVLNVPRRNDFHLDVEGIESLVDAGDEGVRPKLLFITSPGNPAGCVIPRETIERLLALPVVVVVDEAYIEFGGQSVVPLMESHPNLMVLRTFSKWAGMAGLRLGYAVASSQLVGAMARLRPPYNVNGAAVVAALATFDNMDRVRDRIERIIAERERLRSVLGDMPGVEPFPGEANFVFCWLEDRSGQDVAAALASKGILVRAFSDSALVNGLRASVGRPEQNDAFLLALAEVLGVKGVIPMPGARTAEPHARRGRITRQTRETHVSVELNLDGRGEYETDTGLGFLDHMLAQIAAHGMFDLQAWARGDLEVDEHHTVEDVSIALGQALDAALADRQGLVRMGDAYAPLDEALAHVVIDLSGRPYAVVEIEFATPTIGAIDSDLFIHFLETLAVHARMSLHARVLYGRNGHHQVEALFKALGRALDKASRSDPRRLGVPSTKGVL